MAEKEKFEDVFGVFVQSIGGETVPPGAEESSKTFEAIPSFVNPARVVATPRRSEYQPAHIGIDSSSLNSW
jgi:hypothetical protein